MPRIKTVPYSRASGFLKRQYDAAIDLRGEVEDEYGLQDCEADRFVQAIARDWRQAQLSAQDLGLCVFAEQLTRDPSSVGDLEIRALRDCGFEDVAIHDATQIVGYFNYINRVADALAVEDETFVKAWEADPES